MSERELLPCPFCGSVDCRPRYDDVAEEAFQPGHYVLCRGCGASGANVETEAEAIAAWNRRAQPARDVAQLVERMLDAAGREHGVPQSVRNLLIEAADALEGK